MGNRGGSFHWSRNSAEVSRNLTMEYDDVLVKVAIWGVATIVVSAIITLYVMVKDGE